MQTCRCEGVILSCLHNGGTFACWLPHKPAEKALADAFVLLSLNEDWAASRRKHASKRRLLNNTINKKTKGASMHMLQLYLRTCNM